MQKRTYLAAAAALILGFALCSQALAKPRPADKQEQGSSVGVLPDFKICAPGDSSCAKPKAGGSSSTAWNICVATPGMNCCADGTQRIFCGGMAFVVPGKTLDFGVQLANLGPGKSLIPQILRVAIYLPVPILRISSSSFRAARPAGRRRRAFHVRVR